MILVPLWIIFIGSLSFGGAIDDAMARKPAWYVASGLLAGILCTLFIAVQFQLMHYRGSGEMLIALAIASGAWLVYEVSLDFKAAQRRRGTLSTATKVSAIALAVLYWPAVVIGLLQGWQLLG